VTTPPDASARTVAVVHLDAATPGGLPGRAEVVVAVMRLATFGDQQLTTMRELRDHTDVLIGVVVGPPPPPTLKGGLASFREVADLIAHVGEAEAVAEDLAEDVASMLRSCTVDIPRSARSHQGGPR